MTRKLPNQGGPSINSTLLKTEDLLKFQTLAIYSTKLSLKKIECKMKIKQNEYYGLGSLTCIRSYGAILLSKMESFEQLCKRAI